MTSDLKQMLRPMARDDPDGVRFNRIKLLALDFDGVLTNGQVIASSDGHEMVTCSHLDGQGIKDLRQIGVVVIVISGQRSAYVQHRCDKLEIWCSPPTDDKLTELKRVLEREEFCHINLDEVCFVGDDVGDLPVLETVGYPVAVANAIGKVRDSACHITRRFGGNGAVREICDLIIRDKKRFG
ncbi:MAG: HAD hydrolase family protein [Candidatus Paceibacterota bacterium]